MHFPDQDRKGWRLSEEATLCEAQNGMTHVPARQQRQASEANRQIEGRSRDAVIIETAERIAQGARQSAGRVEEGEVMDGRFLRFLPLPSYFNCRRRMRSGNSLEGRIGVEPTNKGFSDAAWPTSSQRIHAA